MQIINLTGIDCFSTELGTIIPPHPTGKVNAQGRIVGCPLSRNAFYLVDVKHVDALTDRYPSLKFQGRMVARSDTIGRGLVTPSLYYAETEDDRPASRQFGFMPTFDPHTSPVEETGLQFDLKLMDRVELYRSVNGYINEISNLWGLDRETDERFRNDFSKWFSNGGDVEYAVNPKSVMRIVRKYVKE